MKHDSNRNYLYPVLRPFSDDYHDQDLKTTVTTEAKENDVNITVEFTVNEPTIRNQVLSGVALCSAMLYCRDTLYRETLKAGKGQFELERAVPKSRLINDVEINAAIVTVSDASLTTQTAHEEYAGRTVLIGQHQPLAIDQPWRFQVNPEQRPTKSIFNLKTDANLLDGEFNLAINPSERYLDLLANEETRRRFEEVRGNENLTISTVFISALMEALAWIKYNDPEDFPSGGWIACIRDNITAQNLDIGDSERNGTHSILLTAQLLLEKPFDRLNLIDTTDKEV